MGGRRSYRLCEPTAVKQLSAGSLAHRQRGREPRCLLAANFGAVLRLTCLLCVEIGVSWTGENILLIQMLGFGTVALNPLCSTLVSMFASPDTSVLVSGFAEEGLDAFAVSEFFSEGLDLAGFILG